MHGRASEHEGLKRKLVKLTTRLGRTNDAARFIDDYEVALYVVMEDLNGDGRDGRFVAMNDIPSKRMYEIRVSRLVRALGRTLYDPRFG